MTDLASGDLGDVLQALLGEASEELFDGAPPAVAVAVSEESLGLGAGARDDPVGPRRESRRESMALDPQQVLGPYRLGTPPAPGHRVVRILVGDAVVFTLNDEEVDWNVGPDQQSFLLRPRAYRSLVGATHVQVAYGVDAVATMLLGAGTATVSLSGSRPLVRRARALALAVLTLDADRLLAGVHVVAEEGDYTTSQRLTALAVTGVQTLSADGDLAICRLALDLTVQVEVRRALREGEGTPITRISTSIS